MTKTQLQTTLAEETGTDRKTAGVFLNQLAEIAYRETKKAGEFTIPGIGKLVKQKRKARTGVNPKTGEKLKIAAKTVVKLRVAKAAKDAVLGGAGAAPQAAGGKRQAAAGKKQAPAAKKQAPAAKSAKSTKAAPAKGTAAKTAKKPARR